MDWFRWWHGSLNDPKFKWVALKSGCQFTAVITLWVALLERASSVTHSDADVTRGDITGFDCDAHDALFDVQDGTCARIYEAFVAKGLVRENRIVKWAARQPKREDSSAERTRAYRERNKAVPSAPPAAVSVTQSDAESRNATTRVDESREELTTYTQSAPAKISIVMRKYAINSNPSHPSIIALAEQGIDLETIEAACKETREAKPNESISIGYIVKKLEGWKREAAAVSVSGARKAPKGDIWWLTNETMSAKARALGISDARVGETQAAFKARIQQAVHLAADSAQPA